MLKSFSLLLFAAFSLQAADGWVGTWKLDPGRSEYKNVDAIKGSSLVITHEGGYYILKFDWTTKNGKEGHGAFRQPDKGGKIIAIGDTDVAYGVLEVPNDHEWVYRYHTKEGKPTWTRYVKLSADGKTLDADVRGMENGKMIVEHEVEVKQ